MKRGSKTSKGTQRPLGLEKVRYQALSAKVTPTVARWVWATAPLHHLAPDVRVTAKGKLLPAKPEFPDRVYEYGFDKEGRVVVAKHYVYPFTDVEFLAYRDGHVDSMEFNVGSVTANPQCARRYLLSEGKVAQVEVHWVLGVSDLRWTDSYEHDGDRLVSAHVTTLAGRTPKQRHTQYGYDARGKLTRVTEGKPEKTRAVVHRTSAKIEFLPPRLVDRLTLEDLTPAERRQLTIAMKSAWAEEGSLSHLLSLSEAEEMAWVKYEVTRAGQPLYDAWILGDDSGLLFVTGKARMAGIGMTQSRFSPERDDVDSETVAEVSNAYAKAGRPFRTKREATAYWKRLRKNKPSQS
jgi:hypothetical protein